jgi:ABC-2 type transport system ATP-binding protein
VAPLRDDTRPPAVTVRSLSKTYRNGVRAVDGVDLDIGRGEIFALLGPNGAGKTTTVEILEGYRSRDSGEVSVLGFDPARQISELKPLIGIVLQSTGVDRYLTVAETIDMYAGYYPHPRDVDEVIDLVGLAAKRDAKVLTLSGGQQRRLDVGVALAGDPELLFLDEPTTGFDPSARREAWEVVKGLAALGKTILLTTHYMEEAQYLADNVAVIAAGRIVAEGPPARLAGRDQVVPRIRFQRPRPDLPLELAEELGVAACADGRLELVPDALTPALARLTAWAVGAGVELQGLEILRPSLEDVYLQLTGSPDEAAEQPSPARGRGRGRRSVAAGAR